MWLKQQSYKQNLKLYLSEIKSELNDRFCKVKSSVAGNLCPIRSNTSSLRVWKEGPRNQFPYQSTGVLLLLTFSFLYLLCLSSCKVTGITHVLKLPRISPTSSRVPVQLIIIWQLHSRYPCVLSLKCSLDDNYQACSPGIEKLHFTNKNIQKDWQKLTILKSK